MTNVTCVNLSEELLQSTFLHAFDNEEKKLIVQVRIHETIGWKPEVKEEDAVEVEAGWKDTKELRNVLAGEGTAEDAEKDGAGEKIYAAFRRLLISST